MEKNIRVLLLLALEYRLSLNVLSHIVYNDVSEEHKEEIYEKCFNECKKISPNMERACHYLFKVETKDELPEHTKKNLDIASSYLKLYEKIKSKEQNTTDEKEKQELKLKRDEILRPTDINFKKLKLKTYDPLNNALAFKISKYRLKYALTRYEVATLIYEDYKEFLENSYDLYDDEYDASLKEKSNSSLATLLTKPLRQTENTFENGYPDIYKKLCKLNEYLGKGYEQDSKRR